VEELRGDEPIFLVTATHGEGDPPETALAFFEMMKRAEASLGGVQYAVLGLGDKSYPEYNKAARDIDAYFAKLGATAFHERGELDVDFASHYPAWVEAALKALPGASPAALASVSAVDDAPL